MIKLPDETEVKWRDLALQFDGHRMQAISLLKMIIKDASDDQYLSVRNFLKSGPLPGEEVLRNRIAEIAEVQRLNATAQPVSDGWVKCCERMPLEKSGKMDEIVVLVTDGNSVGMAACYSGDLPKPWVSFSSYGDVHGTDITHWMPLPAAPGGQDD